MEFIVKKNDIYSGLIKTQSVVDKKSTMPILSNVLIEAKDNILKIRATDLDMGIDTNIPATIKQEGILTVPGKKILEVIRELDADEILFRKRENSYLELNCGTAVFNILSMPADEFPAFPSYSDNVFFKLPSKKISNMIEKTIYAVSTDEIRYVLNGIFFVKVEDKIKMVATDGHRLSLMELSDPFIHEITMEKGVIIPKKGATELKKLLDESNDDIYISIRENNGVFKIGNTVVVMRMINGEFPDYRHVIPERGNNRAIIEKDTFIKVLKRISIMSNEKSKGVKISFKKDELEISAVNMEVGEATETMKMNFKGEPIEMGFNARYFIEMLNCIDGNEVSIDIRDETGPLQVTGTGDEEHLSIIMPMKLY